MSRYRTYSPPQRYTDADTNYDGIEDLLSALDTLGVQSHEYDDMLEYITARHTLNEAFELPLSELRKLVAQARLSAPGIAKKAAPQKPTWARATSILNRAFDLRETVESEFTSAQLRELARSLDLTLKGTLKSAIIEQIVTALEVRAQTPSDFLNGLPAEQARLLRRLYTAWDITLPFPRALATHLLSLDAKPIDGDKATTELLESLRRRALLFPSQSVVAIGQRYESHYQLLAVNEHLAPLMLTDTNLDSAKPASTSAAPVLLLQAMDGFIEAAFRGAVQMRMTLPPHARTFTTAWLMNWEHDAEEAERIMRSRQGWVPDARSGMSVIIKYRLSDDSFELLQDMTGLSREHIYLLYALATPLQLLNPPAPATGSSDDGKLSVNDETFERWIGDSPANKLRQLWNAWATQATSAIECMTPVAEQNAFLVMRAIGATNMNAYDLAAEWCALRRLVVRCVRAAQLQTNAGWIDFEKFLAAIFALRPDSAHTWLSDQEWWLGAASNGQRLDLNNYDMWRKVIGVIIEQIVGQSLFYFGAVECSRNKRGELQSFFVTDVGTWLMTADNDLPADAQPAERTAQPVEWLNPQTVRVPLSANRAELISLMRKIGTSADAPFTYTVNQASVERGFEQNISVDEIAHCFEKFGAPLPAETHVELAALAARFGRVRVYDALTLIECADDVALRELMASTSLAQHIVYQISPRVAVIRDSAVDELAFEIAAKDHTPKVVA
jgi:hypothetical protein